MIASMASQRVSWYDFSLCVWLCWLTPGEPQHDSTTFYHLFTVALSPRQQRPLTYPGRGFRMSYGCSNWVGPRWCGSALNKHLGVCILWTETLARLMALQSLVLYWYPPPAGVIQGHFSEVKSTQNIHGGSWCYVLCWAHNHPPLLSLENI